MKNKISLYICQDDRIPQLCYGLCHNFHHKGNLNNYLYTNTFQINNTPKFFFYPSYNHDNMGISLSYGSKDQINMVKS